MFSVIFYRCARGSIRSSSFDPGHTTLGRIFPGLGANCAERLHMSKLKAVEIFRAIGSNKGSGLRCKDVIRATTGCRCGEFNLIFDAVLMF